MDTNNTYTLNIGNDLVTLRFGAHAKITLYHKLQENPLLLDGDRATAMGVAWIMYAAYCDNCMANGVTPQHEYVYFFEYAESAIFSATGIQIIMGIAATMERCFTQIA